MTDDCCFGEDYGAEDDAAQDAELQTACQRDRETIARLESIADRLAAAAVALAGVLGNKQRSVLDIANELWEAQEALDDFARYGAEQEVAAAFPGKRWSDEERHR
jgi:hypothetical protein